MEAPPEHPTDDIKWTSELATANQALEKKILEQKLVETRLRTEEEALKRSEARMTAIFDSALDCIVTIDHEGRITEFNPAAERVFGYPRETVIGRQLADVIIPPSFRERHRQGFAHYLASGNAKVLGKRMEMTAMRSDGTEFAVELAITRIQMDGPPSFTGYLRDITQRKQSEENLRRSEAYLSEAQQLSHTGSFGWKVSSGAFTWSKETFRIFEFEPTTKLSVELILKRVHPEDVSVVNQVIEQASRDGKDFDFQHRLIMPEGSVKHVRIVAHAEKADSGELEFVGAVMDITAAKETEEYLRTSAKMAQSLVAVRADVSAALSKPTQTRDMLQECAQAIVRHLEVAFARIWILNHTEDVLELQASAGIYTRLDGTHSCIKVGALKVGLIAREQKPYLTNDVLNDPRIGDKQWAQSCGFVSFAGYPLVVESRTVGVIGMFARHPLSNAVNEALASVADTIAQGFQRKRKEDELRRTEAYLSEGQRLSHTGSWAWNVKTKENLFWSREHYRIYGFDPDTNIGHYAAMRERIHPADAGAFDDTLDRAIQARSDFETHHRIILPGGAIKHLHVLGHPVFDNSGEVVEYVGTVMDVTERQRSEEALRKAQGDLARVSRVTTLGELTASIAHEVNQPLGSVINNANACLNLLGNGAPQFSEVRDALAEIIQGADQASAVISRVRQMVTKAPSERTVLNFKDIVADVLSLARHDTAARRVAIGISLAEDMPPIKGDRVQLQQVLLNLIVNGMDAMNATEESKRVLAIWGRHETRDGESRCLIGVQDAGTGFKPDEMDQLFEAFYSTKPQGMGMGLAISRSIIEAHGGRLWAEANEGPGATFLFSLPDVRNTST